MRFPAPSALPRAAPDSGPPPETDPVRRLDRRALAWRSVVLVVGTVLIICGTLFGSDQDWPFGPMSQFAFRTGPDDAITSTFLQARTVDGDLIIVPISTTGVGIGRAEVEGQHVRFERDPQLLGDLAANYDRLHPTKPPLAQLWLNVRYTTLHRGRATGSHVTTLVGWPVNVH